jgi:hypothetical protein
MEEDDEEEQRRRNEKKRRERGEEYTRTTVDMKEGEESRRGVRRD